MERDELAPLPDARTPEERAAEVATSLLGLPSGGQRFLAVIAAAIRAAAREERSWIENLVKVFRAHHEQPMFGESGRLMSAALYEIWTEYRRRDQRLYFTDDELRAAFVRAGGDLECDVCGKKLYDHPQDQVDPFLTVRCDYTRAKL